MLSANENFYMGWVIQFMSEMGKETCNMSTPQFQMHQGTNNYLATKKPIGQESIWYWTCASDQKASGYEYVLTAIDAYSRYGFVILLTN